MSTQVCTEEQFLKDIAAHKMTILHEDGLYRSIKFAREGENSWWNWFTITTWPGYLSINGDMGCYTFSRIQDMFEFFRTKPDKDKRLFINTGYWAEKCVAVDKTCGISEYDSDYFKEVVKEHFEQWDFFSEEEKKECWQEIEDLVLCAENEYEAHAKANDFSYQGYLRTFEFTDFWEHNLKRRTYQYVWCCYAIAWGIQQYDAAKSGYHSDGKELTEQCSETLKESQTKQNT